MTLQDLRNYYSQRINQIAWLERAQVSYRLGADAEQLMYVQLFNWAESMQLADEMLPQIPWSVIEEARGRA